jgi:hypothetical protein
MGDIFLNYKKITSDCNISEPRKMMEHILIIYIYAHSRSKYEHRDVFLRIGMYRISVYVQSVFSREQ